MLPSSWGQRASSWPAEIVPRDLFRHFPCNAVDTTAAGDCFNAAFAVALTRAQPPVEAARYAAAAAAISSPVPAPNLPCPRALKSRLSFPKLVDRWAD